MSRKPMMLAVAIAAMQFLTACGSMMMHESRSPYDFDKTVATITDNARAEGWSIPKIYDIQNMLLEKGKKDIGRMKIVKLCNADYAESLLSRDDSKYVGAMMPCSIAVYEKADGKTYVSSMNMKLMSHMFGGDIGDVLSKVAEADAKMLEFLQ